MTSAISDLTQEHLRASVQLIAKMSESDKWNLSNDEVAGLLGGIDINSYQDMPRRTMNNEPLAMSDDTIERLSLLLAIWKSLQLTSPQGRMDLTYSWFNERNPKLMNHSIKTYLLQNRTVKSFHTVIDYLQNTLDNYDVSAGNWCGRPLNVQRNIQWGE